MKRILLFTVAIVVILVILFLGHLAVYTFLISVFPISGANLSVLQISMGILWLSFILASIISQKFNNLGTRIFYKISAAWLGFFLYLLLGACIYAVIVLFFPVLSQQTTLVIGEVLVGGAMVTSIYGIFNANSIQITTIKVQIPNLPEKWKSRKAVFLSDLHLGQVHAEKFATRIASKIKELRPDIVFIGGDLYDGVAVDAQNVIESFSHLQTSLGIYFITGNHEEFSDSTKYLKAIRTTGIKTLIDEKVIIDGVQLIGVDYAHTAKKAQFDEILRNLNINRGMPSILLKHVPFHLDTAEKYGISLQLSGHTHRAQVFPLTFITRLIYKGFDYGLHPLRGMRVYTSSGVGTWGPPLRVGTRSEIVEILFN